MDNLYVKVISKGDESLAMALKLAWSHKIATHYRIEKFSGSLSDEPIKLDEILKKVVIDFSLPVFNNFAIVDDKIRGERSLTRRPNDRR